MTSICKNAPLVNYILTWVSYYHRVISEKWVWLLCLWQCKRFLYNKLCKRFLYDTDVVDHFYAVLQCCSLLFSILTALLSHVIRLNEWLVFYNALWISTQVEYIQCLVFVLLLHDWCHSKLLLSQHILCRPHNHAPCHITSRKATYIGCTHHLHFWQNDWALLCSCSYTAVEQIPK